MVVSISPTKGESPLAGDLRKSSPENRLLNNSPGSAISHLFFGWEGSPTKLDVMKKKVGTNLFQALNSGVAKATGREASFKLGEVVEYYSASQGAWIPAKAGGGEWAEADLFIFSRAGRGRSRQVFVTYFVVWWVPQV